MEEAVEVEPSGVDEMASSASTATTASTATASTASTAVKKSVKNKPPVAASAVSSASAVRMPPIQLPELTDEKEEAVKEPRGSLPDVDRTFDNIDIVRFGPEVPANDILGVVTAGKKDTYIGRWMSLAGRFPIPDMKNPDIVYPTIEHFMAGMKIRHTSNKPELAEKIMSSKGSIHNSALLKRLNKGIEPESGEDFRLLMDEIDKVRKTNLAQYGIIIKDIVWNSMKDTFLMEALHYRFTNDVRFIKGVTAAKSLGKYLLYSTTASMGGSELGGVRNVKSRKIMGENKVGRFVMELADFKF